MSYVRPAQANDVLRWTESPPHWSGGLITPVADFFISPYQAFSMANATNNSQNWGLFLGLVKYATGIVAAYVQVSTHEYAATNAASSTVPALIPEDFLPYPSQTNRLLTLWNSQSMRIDFMDNGNVIFYRPGGSAFSDMNPFLSTGVFSWPSHVTW